MFKTFYGLILEGDKTVVMVQGGRGPKCRHRQRFSLSWYGFYLLNKCTTKDAPLTEEN